MVATFERSAAADLLSEPTVNMDPTHPPGAEGIGSDAIDIRSHENQSHGGPRNRIRREGTSTSSRWCARARAAARSAAALEIVGRSKGFARAIAIAKTSSSGFVS